MILAHGAVSGSPWSYQPHPEVWVLMLAILGGYLYALRRHRRNAPLGEPGTSFGQATAFVLGVLSMWIVSDWPIDELADGYLFSVHMVQHMTYVFVTPPLLLIGMPQWMLRSLLSPPKVWKVARFLTRPIIAFIGFNVMFVLIHYPPVVNLQASSEPFHFFIHFLLVTSGLLMWWPVVDPLPELSRLSDPAKMLYLFLQSVIPTVPASFLTFGRHALYQTYIDAPRAFGINAVTDQMISGLVMKIGGGLLLWTVIAVMFFKWYSKEEREETPTLTWDDFERDLREHDLRQ